MQSDQKSSKYPPKGLLKLFFRIPVYFYRLGLGWMFGERVVLINHIGRKSGKHYQTVVEVVERYKESGDIIVGAGYGEQTQWYKNLKQLKETTIQLGKRKLVVQIEMLRPEDGGDIIARYLTRYGKLTGQLFSLMGYQWDGTEKDARRIAREDIRFVRFVL